MPNPNPHHVLDRMLDEFAVRLAASTAASKDPKEIVKAPRQIGAAFEIDGGLSVKMTLEIWETGDDQKPVPTDVPETPTPPTDLAARREAENRLAETPIGKALFAYVAAVESAWQQDGNLGAREYSSQRQLTQVRQLFELADLRRRRLVQLLLDAITPAATPPEEPNIARMLDVSTAHLPLNERADLVTGNLPGQTVPTVYGGIINAVTWEAAAGAVPDHASEALQAIMRHALARNCQYVMFDADAPGLDGFPTFDEDS